MAAEYGWTPKEIDEIHPYWILVYLGWKVRGTTKPEIQTSERERKLEERRQRQEKRNAQRSQKTPYGN